LKKLTSQLLLLLIVTIFIGGCSGDQTSEPIDKNNVAVTPKIVAPDFNADTAYAYIKAQADMGPRIPDSKAHEQCAELIISTCKSYGMKVTIQEATIKTFDNKAHKIKNIMASYNPDRQSRIFISAHWDTRPFADQDLVDKDKPINGVNDGASGVGIMLEIARLVKNTNPKTGLDLIFFDLEDYGQPEGSKFDRMEDSWCLGSQHWAKNKPMGYNPNYGINLDMVGAQGAQFFMEAHSLYFAPNVVEKVWNTAAQIGYSSYFVREKSHEITDDHYYVNTLANIPCIDIIQRDPATRSNFYKNWHTHNDNLEGIGKETLKAVGQTLVTVLYNEQ
jgi:hypothetical protein